MTKLKVIFKGIDYITQQQKKLLPIAYDYAIQNKKNDVKVNKTYFSFDMARDEVYIKSAFDNRSFLYGYKVL